MSVVDDIVGHIQLSLDTTPAPGRTGPARQLWARLDLSIKTASRDKVTQEKEKPGTKSNMNIFSSQEGHVNICWSPRSYAGPRVVSCSPVYFGGRRRWMKEEDQHFAPVAAPYKL